MIEAYRRHNRACRDPERELPWPDRSSVQLGLGLVSPAESPSREAVARETHERMQKTVIKFVESLDKRGKTLQQAEVEEVIDLLDKARH